MGQRGPKPQPTAFLSARGSREPQRRAGEPQPEVALPACPEWLPERVRDKWDEIGGELVKLGVMTTVDSLALAMLCEALADYFEFSDAMEKSGAVACSEKGGVYQHPNASLRSNAWMRLMKALREFGMTPSSRTAVRAVKQPAKDNGKSRFFNKKPCAD